jgi:NADH-quinone oxidoreductase subunit J
MITTLISDILFYVLAFVAIGFALLAVNTQHVLRATLYLMIVLIMTAGLYLLLGFEFIAGVQILVYVGGIVVLLIFAVMLTHSQALLDDTAPPRRKVLGMITACGFFVVSSAVLLSTEFPQSPAPLSAAAQIPEIGRKMLDFGSSGYVAPFEVISLLLLAAVLGGIVIARKVPEIEEEGGPS